MRQFPSHLSKEAHLGGPRTLKDHAAMWRILEQVNLPAYEKALTLFEMRQAMIAGNRLTAREVSRRWGLTMRTAERYLNDLAMIEPSVHTSPDGTGFAYGWVGPVR
jgi:hypothetical protein